MTIDRTSIANTALDYVGKDTVVDIDTATTPYAKHVQRNFDANFKNCLRKAPWPFALKRTTLSASSTAPVNEFAYQYNLPADCQKVVKIWPESGIYRKEGTALLTDESAVTIRYVSDECLQDPSHVDPDFAEWVALCLAYRVSWKISNSVDLRKELATAAQVAFSQAASIFSQEDTEEDISDSVWITDRSDVLAGDGSIKIAGLE
jgi:hypothetical protein